MTPTTNTPPVTTEAMTVQAYPFSDDTKRGIQTFLVRRIPVTAIDFYPNPAPAASGIQPKEPQ